MLVSDRGGEPAVTTVKITANGRNVALDLCARHLRELLEGTHWGMTTSRQARSTSLERLRISVPTSWLRATPSRIGAGQRPCGQQVGNAGGSAMRSTDQGRTSSEPLQGRSAIPARIGARTSAPPPLPV